MPERILFLTGALAERRLARALEAMAPQEFDWEVRPVGVKVAALMTTGIIRRRLKHLNGATRVMLPGRARVDLTALSSEYGAPFERGPDDLRDIPYHFGRAREIPDLSRYDVRIFAEIVEAPGLTPPDILARAAQMKAAGADVIDLGCLPDTPFPHLEETVRALTTEGYAVSVDSGDPDELRRGIGAGADFVLSLTEETLGLAEEGPVVPVLVPKRPGDLESLARAVERMRKTGRSFIADPVLDPIHLGFTEALARYRELRRRFPEVEMLMGVGNLTELTDADTTGINAVLMGICSELAIRNVLVVRVSPHCRRAIEEADAARRLMFAAREAEAPPMDMSGLLTCLRDRRPFPSAPEEIAELAREIRDANYRIEASEAGVHLYNRDGHQVGADPFALYPALDGKVDAAHAFYLGVEMARAEIAFRLGKRYVQDRPLDWGVASPRPPEDFSTFEQAGTTLDASRRKKERES